MAVEVLFNPVTTERIEALEQPSAENGQRVRMCFSLEPHKGIAGPHRHPAATQTFWVESGVLSLRVGNETRTLRAGESASVPPNTIHDQWNESDEREVAIEESEPAPRA